MMKNRHRHALPLLATLAGCVFMLAWVDPAHATEVTRQLTQKGFVISQLRKSEVAIVRNSGAQLKVMFRGFDSPCAGPCTTVTELLPRNTHHYLFIFPRFVKLSLQDGIRTWMKRE
ncbi:MAG TPA: hypothetical protein VFU15_11710 [Bacteroidia bacterium]|nr:hypothetical protein [Bacteroidia bacterium]